MFVSIIDKRKIKRAHENIPSYDEARLGTQGGALPRSVCEKIAEIDNTQRQISRALTPAIAAALGITYERCG